MNIRFENRLRKLLQESSGKEKVKRLLNEALSGAESACRAAYKENSNYVLACVYGCIPQTGELIPNVIVPAVGGNKTLKQAVILPAKQPVTQGGYTYNSVIVEEPSPETGQMNVYMVADKSNLGQFLMANVQGQQRAWYATKACQDLLPNLNPALSGPAKQALAQLQTYFKDTATQKPYIVDWETGNKDPNAIQGGWQPMKLGDFIQQNLANKPELAAYYKVVEGQKDSPTMIWYKGGAYSEFYGNQSDTARDAWVKGSGLPWKAGKCEAGTEATCTVKNLKDPKDNPYTYKEFTQDVFVHMDNSDLGGDQLVNAMKSAFSGISANGYTKESCKPLLQAYQESYKKDVQMNPQTIDSFKGAVAKCAKQFNYTLGVDDKLFDVELQKPTAIKGNTNYSLGSGAVVWIQGI